MEFGELKMDYEIKNYYFDLNGMYLRFKNNSVPNVDAYSDHPLSPVYFRPRVKVEYDHPYYDWDGGFISVASVYDFTNYPLLLPKQGEFTDYYLDFRGALKSNITLGYVDSDVSEIVLDRITFDNKIDLPNNPWEQGEIHPTDIPDFPIIIYKTISNVDDDGDGGNDDGDGGNDEDNTTPVSNNNLLLWCGLALLAFWALGGKK